MNSISIAVSEVDESLASLFSALDLRNSLSVLADAIKKKEYHKVSEYLKNDTSGFTADLNWNKKLSVLLTEDFSSSDEPWATEYQEPIAFLMDYLADRLVKTSSSNAFLCLFHGNKRVLRAPAMWSYKFQSKLLTSVLAMTCTDKSKLATFRSAMYSICWNQMRDHMTTATAEANQEKLIMSCRWLLLDNLMINLSKMTSKLRQNLNWFISMVEDKKLVHSLLGDLWMDYKRIVKNEGKSGLLSKNEDSDEQKEFLCTYVNVTTEVFAKLKEFDKGLKWLACWLTNRRSILDERTGLYDVFRPPSFLEWGAQWVYIKFAAKNAKIQQKTLLELFNDKPETEEIIQDALLLELNSYFTRRCVLSDAIVTVGEHLQDVGRNKCEKALGYLAQAIGFWWDDEDTNEEFCIEACEKTLEILNELSEKEVENPQVLILSAVAKAWLGLMLSKALSTVASKDLEFVQEEEQKEVTERVLSQKLLEPDSEPDELLSEPRAVPGITSVNLSHEHEVASLIINCVDSLFTVVQFEKTAVKKWFDISPALILLTARLCALRLSAYGDTYTTIRAWHVCYVLAELYDRKSLQFLSGLELVKLMPEISESLYPVLEKLEEDGIEVSGHYLPKAYFSQLNLAKAEVALKQKKYADGIVCLAKVFDHPPEKANVDITFLVMAQATHLLAQYLIAYETNKFDNLCLIDEALSQLTPSSLVIRAYKIFCSVPRTHKPHDSGWDDLFFNQQLLVVMLTSMPGTMKILKDEGNIKELLSYGADMINFSQCYGYISRTISVLLLLAEHEFSSGDFKASFEKLDAIQRLLFSSDFDAGIIRVEMQRSEVELLLRKLNLHTTYKMPNPMPNTKITISIIETPGPRPTATESTGPVSPTVPTQRFKIPRFLFHSLNCPCYVCIHPSIIPLTLKYLHLVGRYGNYGAGDVKKTAVSLFSALKDHQIKAAVRILNHFERVAGRLAQAFHSKEAVSRVLKRIYLPFMVNPGINLMYTLAQLTPVTNLEYITKCCKTIEGFQKIIRETDEISLHEPMEIIFAAVFKHYSEIDNGFIKDSSIRDSLPDFMDASILEDTIIID